MTAAARDLLTRLTERYQPPSHLAMNARARAAVLADYENALSGFDAHTLGQAWQRVTAHHTSWTWPSCGELVKAAEFFAPRRRGPSEEEQKREQARELADAYTARFLEKFHLARLARHEGWLEPLKHYVEAAAWVQAQLIAGVVHVGWDAQVLLPEPIGQGGSQALFDAYRATTAVANAVARGQVRVEVPKDRIAAWKEAARHQAAGMATNGPSLGNPAARPDGQRAFAKDRGSPARGEQSKGRSRHG
jgi:hypothetical protein